MNRFSKPILISGEKAMGAGRKKETYTLAPDSLNSYVNWNARNLEKRDLCGVIFGCKFSTIKECYAKKLFG